MIRSDWHWQIFTIGRLPCVILFLIINIPAVAAFYLANLVNDIPWSVNLITFWFILMVDASIWMTYLSDPGFVSITKAGCKEYDEIQAETKKSDDDPSSKSTHKSFNKTTCYKCKIVRPPKAHHCSQCNRCVLEMDHHCPWLGNCIGYENYHHFLQVLVNGALASLAVFIFIILNMFYFSKKTIIHSELSTKQHFFYTFQNPLWNLFCGLSGFFLLSLVGMMINFLELFLQEMSSLEYVIQSKNSKKELQEYNNQKECSESKSDSKTEKSDLKSPKTSQCEHACKNKEQQVRKPQQPMDESRLMAFLNGNYGDNSGKINKHGGCHHHSDETDFKKLPAMLKKMFGTSNLIKWHLPFFPRLPYTYSKTE